MPSLAEERFIAAATAPLADNAELQLMAAQELGELIPQDASEPAMTSAAEAMERKPRFPRWRTLLYLLTALACIIALVPTVRDYARLRIASWALFGMTDPLVQLVPFVPVPAVKLPQVPGIFGKFTHQQQLLLFGNLNAPSHDLEWKALWESEPENPAFFSEYLRACFGSGKPLPPDALLIADRIDPGNAWYRHLAAAAAARDAIDRNPKWGKGKKYIIKDPTRLAESIALLESAAKEPRYESYISEILRRRSEILPPGDDLLSRRFTQEYFHMVPPNAGWMFPAINRMVSVQAGELAAKGEGEALRRLSSALENLLERSVESGCPGGYLADLDLAARELTAAGKTLGVHEVEARYASLEKILKQDRAQRQARYYSFGPAERKAEGNLLAKNVLNPASGLRQPPSVTTDELKAGRMATQALATRLFALGGMACFVIAIIVVTLFPLRHGKQARRLSAALLGVLRPADHIMILVGGVALPFAIYQLASHLGQGMQLGEADLKPNLAIGGLMLVLPVLIAGSRLGRRLGFLGWRRNRVAEVVACTSGIIVWLACSRDSWFGLKIDDSVHKGLDIVLVGLCVGVLMLPFCILFRRRRKALPWLTLARAVFPAYALALLLAAATVPIAHAVERHWTRLDEFTRLQPGIPAASRYGYETDRQSRAEILELLKAKP